MSTDVRLENYRKDDAVDPGLEALLFQYGRYLLIASSRPGSLPANLQGVWNNRTSPPWRSDYHLNINVQMNYWPAGPCNLLECQEPLIDYIDHLRTPGADTAKAYHNARGWTANLCGNIWGYTCMNYTEHKRKPIFWTYFPLGGAWLATHAYEHYAFGGDKDYLDKRLWPILSSQADFLVDYHYTLPDGTLASTPSWSPEHGPISWGATFDHAAAKEALRGAIRVAAELGETGPRIMAWKETLAKIVPYKVGKHGQLQEWYEDIDSPTDKHRHVNHLFGLHPGSQITFANSPDLIKACKTTLAQRGDSGTGWSLAWKINFWARLHDGNHAHVLAKRLLRKNIHPNFFDTHPPFQIDGNFGATAGIAEMLLQSHEHDPTGNPIIRLLPALPSAWPSGKVTGLRARGGSELDIQWKDGKLASVTVRANQPGTVVIRYGELTKRLKLVPETTQTLNSDLAPRGGKQ